MFRQKFVYICINKPTIMNIKNTESKAIEIAKSMLTDGFTISYMNSNEVENFIWGYLYDNSLQYKIPIEYTDQFGNNCAAIVYQNK